MEDHNLAHINFEGIIPKGMYGAGPVVVWDNGTYDLLEREKDKLVFFLRGKELKGTFSLVRFKGNEKEWLLIKQKDKFASPGWKLKTSLTPEKLAELRERVQDGETT